ncbi:MAG TPA: RNA polymerase sigma-70 factor [Chitinophaga sp.]
MQHISNDTDKALLNGIAAGNEAAYRMLFERYWDTIYSAALLLTKSPEISEDVTQDVFAMIWEKRDELARVDNLQAFLFVSARNKIYSRLRKLSSQDTYQEYLRLYLRESQGSAGEDRIYSRDLEQLVQRAILKLPPQQQRAFRLSRFEGMDHAQIAALMGVSRVTIKSYIVQALATLRKLLSYYTLPFLVAVFLGP